MTVYLAIMALTALLSYGATWGALWLGRRFSLYAPIRERDIHARRVARLGGLGLYGSIATVLVVASQTYFVEKIFHHTFAPWGVLLGMTVIFCVGFADDLWDLPWWVKLIGQILGALVVALWGVRMRVFPFPGGPLPIESPYAQICLTVFLIVLVMNALNFIDGLDGLAAGVALIGAAAFFICSYWVNRNSELPDWSDLSTLLTAILVGACAGFLFHNWHPARIFMGDAGALVIGLVLASSGIAATGLKTGLYDRAGGIPIYMPIILPIAILLVPVLDLSLAVVRRTVSGRSPFTADRSHLHHRLLDQGHSHRGAVGLLYIWTFVVAFGGAAFAMFPWQIVLPTDLVALALVAFLTIRRQTGTKA